MQGDDSNNGTLFHPSNPEMQKNNQFYKDPKNRILIKPQLRDMTLYLKPYNLRRNTLFPPDYTPLRDAFHGYNTRATCMELTQGHDPNCWMYSSFICLTADKVGWDLLRSKVHVEKDLFGNIRNIIFYYKRDKRFIILPAANILKTHDTNIQANGYWLECYITLMLCFKENITNIAMSLDVNEKPDLQISGGNTALVFEMLGFIGAQPIAINVSSLGPNKGQIGSITKIAQDVQIEQGCYATVSTESAPFTRSGFSHALALVGLIKKVVIRELDPMRQTTYLTPEDLLNLELNLYYANENPVLDKKYREIRAHSYKGSDDEGSDGEGVCLALMNPHGRKSAQLYRERPTTEKQFIKDKRLQVGITEVTISDFYRLFKTVNVYYRR